MKLIETNSPLYLKRLVHELNATVDGFYASVATFNVRCNRARFRNGAIQVHSFSCKPEWFQPSDSQMVFTDAYGREIVASRKA